MKRHLAILIAILACTLSAVAAAPNVIIFLMDDFGLTDVQAHPTYFPDGSPLYETPNMHRLASEGMRFRNAYAQPLCSASRFSLLSGQYSAARYSLWAAITKGSDPDPSLPTSSNSSRAYNFPGSRDHMPLEIETIAERLKAAGYATWHAGKWHLSPHENGTNPDPITNFYPVAQGFDKQLSVGGAGPRPGYFGPFTMPDEATVTTFGYKNYGVRSERYRYIVYEDGSEELYDHKNDKWEWENLADNPEYAAIKTKMRQELPTHHEPDGVTYDPPGRKRKAR